MGLCRLQGLDFVLPGQDACRRDVEGELLQVPPRSHGLSGMQHQVILHEAIKEARGQRACEGVRRLPRRAQ